jgi:HWE histidine kinase
VPDLDKRERTVQAITWQTLRVPRDLPSAREALDRRIQAMARAHDLLTARAWTGANLTDLATRALDAFPQTQVKISGDAIDVSPRHALTLSVALHELATNARRAVTAGRARECALGRARWDAAPGLGKKAADRRSSRRRGKASLGRARRHIAAIWQPGTSSNRPTLMPSELELRQNLFVVPP